MSIEPSDAADAVPHAGLQRLIFAGLWAVRRCVPLLLVRPVIWWKIYRLRRDPVAVDNARSEMRHLMGISASATAVDAEADRHLAHWVWWHELRWHPRRITRQRVEGVENLKRAHAEGRGVVLCFVHHGQFGGLFRSVSRHGFHVAVVTAASAIRGIGPSTRQYARVVGSGGSLISSDSGVRGLQNALEQGQVVASAIDVPGRTVVKFGGQRVRCSAGGVVASIRSGAPVVVATSHRWGRGTVIRLSEPISPAGFGSVDELAQALVQLHEDAVLAWPCASYLPKTCWTLADE